MTKLSIFLFINCFVYQALGPKINQLFTFAHQVSNKLNQNLLNAILKLGSLAEQAQSQQGQN